jgi:hypothetical protein
MQMKKTILITLILMVVSVSNAQQMIDVVYLFDGSIIKGKIVENTSTSVKIETCCGNVLAFPNTEVERTAQEPVINVGKSIKQKGYMNFTSMGVLVGSSSNDKAAPFSALMEHNYKFNKYFAAGGLIGFELLNETTFPVALNLKAFLPLSTGNLFLGVSGGYSLSTEKPDQYGVKSASGGVMVNSEIGYIIPVSENAGIYIAIGYRCNELNYKTEEWWMNSADRTIYFNRISIRLGISIY